MFIQPTNSQQKNFSSLSSSALTVMCFRLTLVLLCVLTCSVTGFAQWNVSNTAGSTPSGIAPGAPAGTYPLSGFEQMNYFNGNLNVTLPLLKVGGRGGAQFTIPLNVRTHPWRVEGAGTPISNSNTVCYTYFAENNWWQPVDPKPNYGAGIMTTRLPGQGVVFDQNSQQYYNSAVRARLTFSAPDGTEYDFYDQLSNQAKERRYLEPTSFSVEESAVASCWKDS